MNRNISIASQCLLVLQIVDMVSGWSGPEVTPEVKSPGGLDGVASPDNERSGAFTTVQTLAGSLDPVATSAVAGYHLPLTQSSPSTRLVLSEGRDLLRQLWFSWR